MPMPLEEDPTAMKLKLRSLPLAAAALVGAGLFTGPLSSDAQAQNAILSEMYGRGVHAYFSNNSNDAYQFLTSAIQAGLKDPRAYYFRGLAAKNSGRQYEAEADWQAGAEIEAQSGTSPAIGQSLSRIQGHDRLKLEEIRRKAKLDALALANVRSQQRYGEIDAAQPQEVSGSMPRRSSPLAPPPPPTSADAPNPFSDDLNMAGGEAKVESKDAFGDVLDDVPMETPMAGGEAPAAGTKDPFGAPAAAGGDDIFGAPAGGDAADPFGSAPADDDPFGN